MPTGIILALIIVALLLLLLGITALLIYSYAVRVAYRFFARPQPRPPFDKSPLSIDQTTITSMPCASTAQYNVVVQNSDNLKLRRGPGAEHYQLVGYIPNGTVLSISQTMINSFDGRPWGRTTFNGYTGWISLDWTYRQ